MGETSKILWIVRKAVRFCFPYIFVKILVISFTAIIPLITNVINKDIINELEALSGIGTVSSLFIGLILVYMSLYFVSRAGGFLGAFGSNFFKLNVDMLFHKIFMWRSCNTPQERFFEHEFMERYSFVSANTGKISRYIESMLGLVFSGFGTLAGTTVLFAIYEPWLIPYTCVILICSIIVNRYIAKQEYELDKKQIKEQRFHDYYKALLTGKGAAKELRIYKFKDFIYQKWTVVYDKLRIERLTLSLKKTFLQNVNIMVKFMLRAGAIALLLLRLYQRSYDAGTFIMLFGLAQTCANQVDSLTQTIIYGGYKYIKYMNDYYDFVTPISNEEIKIVQSETNQDGNLAYGEFLELKVINATYIYPNSTAKAVDNVSLTVKRGEIISILGYNGSGKTTLSKLLNCSLIPTEGLVALNGVPMAYENRNEIYKYYGIAPQEFSGFSIPIRELIGLGRIEKMNEDEELEDAYRKAGIHAFTDKYQNGDMTVLGKEYDDQGVDLSGGEWQRLIIASAYMGQPEILIMDEPTAAIDPLKEMEMLSNFRDNLKGKTAILISHRIGFARLADRIIMMNDGKISEQGTHEQLLSSGGYYSRLFNEQRSLYQDGEQNG